MAKNLANPKGSIKNNSVHLHSPSPKNVEENSLMSHKTKLVLGGAVIIFCIVTPPILIIWANSSFYNPLTQILLDSILLVISIWIGTKISNEDAKKQAIEKWVPAAEMACKALLAMNAIIERRQWKRGKDCKLVLEPFMTNTPDKSQEALKAVVKMRCGECNEMLLALKAQINTILSVWDAYIEDYCEEDVCDEIHKRLRQTRGILKDTLEIDFIEPSASAKAVKFDETLMHIFLTDGRIICIPITWISWLEKATSEQRERCKISEGGDILRWAELNEE